MSPLQQKPILHGRDHTEGGPDPIPGLRSVGASGASFLGHRIGTTEDRWYAAGLWGVSAPATSVTIASTLDLFPFMPGRDMTLDRIAVQVTSAVAGNARLGFYTDDGNIYPDALLFDTGTFSTSSTGPKVQTISEDLIAGVLYWAAIAVESAAAQLRSWQSTEMVPIVGADPWSGTGQAGMAFGWRLTHASAGALPDPFTGGATPYTATLGNPYAIHVRGT